MAEFLELEWAIPFALKERVYSGGVDGRVTVREATDKRSLDRRTDLHDYSTMFEWGHDSAGAA
jgi:hypothetical protein